ncbi:MAG TPA: UDP-glucose 4-epimerase GalE [Patescibacteria group bacterium]|nr:UDP-glucose 4-epimerase GalE [Patescibacteria group bacterium]
MNILVTGGAGYIGSHTVRRLTRDGHRPVVYDNLVTGHAAAVTGQTFVAGDLFDRERLQAVLRQEDIGAVVHFAAFSQVGESMDQPARYYGNNVAGTLCLLDSMLATGVKKLVFSSTAAVYGEPEASPITEECGKNPTNVYGRTKLMMENVMADYSRAYGLNYVALRYFNACGADPAGDIGEDHRPETHLIPLVLQACLGQRNSIKIFGDDYPTRDGTCVRDYIHVNDLAQAHCLALDRLNAGNGSGVYNLGNGGGFTVQEIVTAAEAVTGITITREITGRRAGDPALLVAGAEKARRELGWQPEFPHIQEILQTAWRWHQNHPRGYETPE